MAILRTLVIIYWTITISIFLVYMGITIMEYKDGSIKSAQNMSRYAVLSPFWPIAFYRYLCILIKLAQQSWKRD